MKGKTLNQITNTPKAGLKELPSLPDNEEFNVEIISKDSGKVYTVSTDAFNSNISGSSALFPNGNEEVLASRDFQLSDAGKILYINEPDVIISMPLVNPFQVGDNIGVLKSEMNNSGFSLNGSDIIPLRGETVLITNILSGADVVPVLVSTTTINDGGVDKTALSYLYDKVTNAIPLSGTVEGSPVTGDIEFNTGGGILKHFNEDLDEYNFLRLSNTSVQLSVNESSQITSLEVGQGVITVHSDDVYNVGLTGDRNFNEGAGYLPNLYAQIAYVGARGTATLSSGTVTVATDKVKTGYKIYLSVNTPSGTQGFLSAPTGSIVDATSFVINSTNAGDNSTVNWWIAP